VTDLPFFRFDSSKALAPQGETFFHLSSDESDLTWEKVPSAATPRTSPHVLYGTSSRIVFRDATLPRSVPVRSVSLFPSLTTLLTEIVCPHRIGMAEIEEVKQGQHDWKVLEPGRTKPPGTSPQATGFGDLPPLPGM